MLPLNLDRLKAGRCLPVVLTALLFAGCTTPVPDQSVAHLQDATPASSTYYLRQMQQSADDSKTNWQLLAIHALLEEGKTRQAIELYIELPQTVNDAQRRELLLLAPEIKISQQEYAAAATLLDKLDPSSLNPAQRNRYYQAVINASQGRPSLTLLRAYIAKERQLTGDAHQKNIDDTWRTLSQFTPTQMNSLTINADEYVLQGWLDLLHIWNDSRNDPELLRAGIKEWQTRYPGNPGAKTLPGQLTNAQNIQAVSTAKIALLLPLDGQAAVFGRAILQGFEAAKNAGSTPLYAPQVPAPSEDNDAQLTNPAPTVDPLEAAINALANEQPVQSTTQSEPAANPSAELKVYDTSSQPLDQLLAQVQQDGITMVVGPLLKNDVDRIADSHVPLNILALNRPENIQSRPNICYFALSPEDEARDAAAHIWQQNHRNPLLLVPYSMLGNRVTTAFVDEWNMLGGGLVLQQKFGSVSTLRRAINSGSGIELTGTPVNTSSAMQPDVTADNLNITSARTTDSSVDAVYIVATPDEVVLIKPMITMRTGSRSSVQLYASSRSDGGVNGPDFLLEMDGMQFSEIPALSGNNPPLMQQTLNSVGNDYSLARLYAMGTDAWSLVNRFVRMRQPGFQFNGNTGLLTTSQDCVVNRKLNWLQFSQGQIIPLP